MKFRITAIVPLRNTIELREIGSYRVFYFKSRMPVMGTFVWGAVIGLAELRRDNMKQRKLADTPPMTVRELREYIETRPTSEDVKDTLDIMLPWYFDNCHLITIVEDAAFRRYLGELQRYTQPKGT